jgi:peptide/nickel transport system ATP-binding protein
MTGEPLLSVRSLDVDFTTYGRRSRVLRGVSLDVPAHRHVALVGESGCGKSVTMRTIMGILPTPPARVVAGEIWFDGRDLIRLGPDEREALRGTAMSMVFQDPMTSLNPVFTILDQMSTIL